MVTIVTEHFMYIIAQVCNQLVNNGRCVYVYMYVCVYIAAL